MTQIYFAGVNTTPLVRATVGRHVLVSYADIVRRPGWWRDQLKPRLEAGAYETVMLDSGAFTEYTDPTFHVDLGEYVRFCVEHGHLFDWTVTLDDIGGDVDRTQRNTAAMRDAGLDPLVVFHQGEPWSVLDSYVEQGCFVGLGMQRVKGRLPSPAKVRAYLDRFFQRLAGRAHVHGLGLTRYALDGYPFYSCDSTTWIAEWSMGLKACDPQASEVAGRYGLAGPLARELACLTREAQLYVVLEAYEGLPDMPSVETILASGEDLPDWTALVPVAERLQAAARHEVRGQARSALARYSVESLAAVLYNARLLTGVQRGELDAEGHLLADEAEEALAA